MHKVHPRKECRVEGHELDQGWSLRLGKDGPTMVLADRLAQVIEALKMVVDEFQHELFTAIQFTADGEDSIIMNGRPCFNPRFKSCTNEM